ncbi:MAG: hypothetical protein QXV60_03550 [Nitrososphaerota archaeon]
MAKVWLAVHTDTVYRSSKLIKKYPYLRGVEKRDNKIVGALDNKLSIKAVEGFGGKVVFYGNEEYFYYVDKNDRVVMEENNSDEGLKFMVEYGSITKNDIVLVVDVDGYNKIQQWDISLENPYGFDIDEIRRIKYELCRNNIRARYRMKYKVGEDSTYLISKYKIRTMAIICPVYPIKVGKEDRINGYQHSKAGTWTNYDTYCKFKEGIKIVYEMMENEIFKN